MDMEQVTTWDMRIFTQTEGPAFSQDALYLLAYAVIPDHIIILLRA